MSKDGGNQKNESKLEQLELVNKFTLPLDDEIQRHGEEHNWEKSQGGRRFVERLTESDLEVKNIDVSPDGRLTVATARKSFLDTDSGDRFVHTFVCVSDAITGHSKWFKEWDLQRASFSPDGSQLLACFNGRKWFRIYDSETGDQVATVDNIRSVVCDLAGSQTGMIASALGNGTISLWTLDGAKGVCVRTLRGHSKSALCVAFSPDGKRLASGSEDTTVRVWDVASGLCLQVLTGHSKDVTCVAFAPDGSKLASTSRVSSNTRVWDTRDFSCTRSIGGASQIDGAENGKADGEMKVVPEGQEKKGDEDEDEEDEDEEDEEDKENKKEGTTSISWSSDSSLLAVTADGILQLWNESGVNLLSSKIAATAAAFSLSSFDLFTLVSHWDHGKISRWNWSKWSKDANTDSIPFGRLYPPSSSRRDVAGVLDRISTIIQRMDPPTAFNDQIKRLHDLNNPSFINLAAKAKLTRDIEHGFSELTAQHQIMLDQQKALRLKAHQQHLSAVGIKEDITSLAASHEQVATSIPILRAHLSEVASIRSQSESQSESSSSSALSPLASRQHPSPKEIDKKELTGIIEFAKTANVRLNDLGLAVIKSAKKFEKHLIEYDTFSAEIREQSEKNLDAIDAFLAHLTQPSIQSERIYEIETTLAKLQDQLGKEMDIASKLEQCLADLSQATGQLDQLLGQQAGEEKTGRDGNGQKRRKMDQTPETQQTPRDSRLLEPQISELDIDNAERLRQGIEHAKAALRSSATDFVHHPHLIFKWLLHHPESKLEVDSVFEIIGLR